MKMDKINNNRRKGVGDRDCLICHYGLFVRIEWRYIRLGGRNQDGIDCALDHSVSFRNFLRQPNEVHYCRNIPSSQFRRRKRLVRIQSKEPYSLQGRNYQETLRHASHPP